MHPRRLSDGSWVTVLDDMWHVLHMPSQPSNLAAAEVVRTYIEMHVPEMPLLLPMAWVVAQDDARCGYPRLACRIIKEEFGLDPEPVRTALMLIDATFYLEGL